MAAGTVPDTLDRMAIPQSIDLRGRSEDVVSPSPGMNGSYSYGGRVRARDCDPGLILGNFRRNLLNHLGGFSAVAHGSPAPAATRHRASCFLSSVEIVATVLSAPDKSPISAWISSMPT